MSEAIALRGVLHELIASNAPRPDAHTIKRCADEIFEGLATPAQIGAFLTLLHVKGETLVDVVAFAQIMREKSKKVAAPEGSSPIDMCGTGGDHSGTFNISTAASLVVASSGIPVAKHGNRAASSKCGSADVLEALGVNLAISPEASEKVLAKTNICFMFAQVYHQAMKHVAAPRRELGFRTVFNLLGPLTNPAGVKRQLVGVGSDQAYDLYPAALKELGSERVLIVRGEGGMDEITPYGETRCRELANGEVKDYVIAPSDFKRPEFSKEDLLAADDAAGNAQLLRDVLSGADQGAKRAAVVYNAGAAIYVADKATTLADGFKLAEKCIDDGSAVATLDAFIEATNAAD